MDTIYEVPGRFRIQNIPCYGTGSIFYGVTNLHYRNTPFCMHFRENEDAKTEYQELPNDLFRVIVGSSHPEIITAMTPYLVDGVKMSDGMLAELLKAPAALAQYAIDNQSERDAYEASLPKIKRRAQPVTDDDVEYPNYRLGM